MSNNKEQLAIRFLNKISDGLLYKAFIRVNGIDEPEEIYSDKDFVTVYYILDDGMQHIAHLVIFDKYNRFVYNTSAFFEYNTLENQIKVSSDILPAELEFERVDGFHFNLILHPED